MPLNNNKKRTRATPGGLNTLGVLLNYGIACIVPRAGVKRLIATLGSPNEDASMAAYMALVKLGPKNAAKLVEELGHGHKYASLLQLLGDLGEQSVIPVLEQFAQSTDAEFAETARESIAALKGNEPDKV